MTTTLETNENMSKITVPMNYRKSTNFGYSEVLMKFPLCIWVMCKYSSRDDYYSALHSNLIGTEISLWWLAKQK